MIDLGPMFQRVCALFFILSSLGIATASAAIPPVEPPHGSLMLFQDAKYGTGTTLEIYMWDGGNKKFLRQWQHTIAQHVLSFDFAGFASGRGAILRTRSQAKNRLYHVDLRQPTPTLQELTSVIDPTAICPGWGGTVLVADAKGGLTRITEDGQTDSVLPSGMSLNAQTKHGVITHISAIGPDHFVTLNQMASLIEIYDLRQGTSKQPVQSILLSKLILRPRVHQIAQVDSVDQMIASPQKIYLEVNLTSYNTGMITLETASGSLLAEDFSMPGTLGQFLAVDALGQLTLNRLNNLQTIDSKGLPLFHSTDFFAEASLRKLGVTAQAHQHYLASSIAWSWPLQVEQSPPLPAPPPSPAAPTLAPTPAATPVPLRMPAEFTARDLARYLSAYTPEAHRAPREIRELIQHLEVWELSRLGLEPYGLAFDLVPGKEKMILSAEQLIAALEIASVREQKKKAAAQCAAALQNGSGI